MQWPDRLALGTSSERAVLLNNLLHCALSHMAAPESEPLRAKQRIVCDAGGGAFQRTSCRCAGRPRCEACTPSSESAGAAPSDTFAHSIVAPPWRCGGFADKWVRESPLGSRRCVRRSRRLAPACADVRAPSFPSVPCHHLTGIKETTESLIAKCEAYAHARFAGI